MSVPGVRITHSTQRNVRFTVTDPKVPYNPCSSAAIRCWAAAARCISSRRTTSTSTSQAR
jgi:hypothetical protein